MKLTKRIAATAAAMVMAMSVVGMTAFASEPPAVGTSVISVGDSANNTYGAYQIFQGNYENGELLTKDLSIGYNVNAANLYAALNLSGDDKTPANALKALDGMSAEQILSVLKTDGVIEGNPTPLVKGESTELSNGYYYISESDADGGQADILLKLDANTQITPKLGAPKVEKKVKEDDRTVSLGDVMDEDLYEPKYNDAADYCIGEAVPFELVGSLPETLGNYTNGYYYEFVDRLAAGFVAPETSAFQVLLNGETDITDQAAITKTVNADGSANFSIKFNNIKAVQGVDKDSKIVVKYSAVLDTDAVIGRLGNTNGVTLKYSTDYEYDGNGIDDHGEHDDTTETAPDGTVVFTYTLDATKTDEVTQEELDGAKFKLLNADKTKAAIITNGKFAGWADDVDSGTEVTTEDDGKFIVAGLDSEKYYIRETEAPEGYTPLGRDIEFTVNVDMNNAGDWTYVVDNGTTAFEELQVTDSGFTPDTDNGTIATEIVNAKEGAELPETGGIGTTLFYVGGGLTAAAAGVVLVARKRAKREQ